MKKKLALIALVSSMLIGQSLLASVFSKESTKGEHEQLQKMNCISCNMNLKIFWKTSHAVELENGDYFHYCSMSDLIRAEQKLGSKIKKYLAVDSSSEKLMDATKLTYVVGSSVKGTMSTKSKIAFKLKEDAIEFQKEFGGEIKSFTGAKEYTLSILDSDNEMMKKKHHHDHNH